MIYHNQQRYYDALQQSHKSGVDCQPFIDFMLDVIENAMCRHIEPEKSENGGINGGLFGGINATQKEIIVLIQENPNVRAFEMAQKLLKPVRTIENNLSQLKEKGIVARIGSKKTGYWRIK